MSTPKTLSELQKPEAMATMPAIDNGKVAKALSSDAFGIFDPALFDHLWRIGKAFASTKLVPVHFQGKQEDCFIAAALAMELKANPLIVMQNIYVVHGTPGFSTKFAIALANERGPFKDIIQFKEVGEKGSANYGVVAFAHTKKGSYCEFKADMAMAKAEGWTKNTKYQSMPDVMLAYRAASFLIRRHCPEVLFGMKTSDEVEFQSNSYADTDYIDGEVVIEPAGEDYKESEKDSPTIIPAETSQKADEETTQAPKQEAKKEAPKPATKPPAAEPPLPVGTEGTMSLDDIRGMIKMADPKNDDDLASCIDLLNSAPAIFKDTVMQDIAAIFGRERMVAMLGGDKQAGLALE